MPARRSPWFPSLVALAIAASGCHSAAFTRARSADTLDAWRAFLLVHDEGSEASYARDRLEAISWRAALAEGTPHALRQFLDDFPESAHRAEAERRLAALRYRAAERSGVEAAWRGFLEEEPKTDLARGARRTLADLEFRTAVASRGPGPVALYLARFPDGPHLAEARSLLDDRTFAGAAARGLLGLASYLEAFPGGRHRAQARARADGIRVTALIAEERFDEAARLIAVLPAARQTAAEAALAAARRRVARCDLERLRRTRRDRRIEELEAQALLLSRPDRAAVEQAAGELEATDPRDRWAAAAELGATGSIWAIDPLLGAVSRSPFWKVRLVAAAALHELFSAFPEAVREEEASRRILALRPRAASSELCDQLGLLESEAGIAAEARTAFLQARRYSPDDLFALDEELRLAGRDDPAAPALARELAAGAERYAVDHLWQETLPLLLADRQICGLDELAGDALDALQAAGAPGHADLVRAREHRARLSTLLADAERGLHIQDRKFQGCDSERPARIAAGVTRRLAAVGALVAGVRGAPAAEVDAVRAILEEAAAHDGARRVRDAAREAAARLTPPG